MLVIFNSKCIFFLKLSTLIYGAQSCAGFGFVNLIPVKKKKYKNYHHIWRWSSSSSCFTIYNYLLIFCVHPSIHIVTRKRFASTLEGELISSFNSAIRWFISQNKNCREKNKFGFYLPRTFTFLLHNSYAFAAQTTTKDIWAPMFGEVLCVKPAQLSRIVYFFSHFVSPPKMKENKKHHFHHMNNECHIMTELSNIKHNLRSLCFEFALEL